MLSRYGEWSKLGIRSMVAALLVAALLAQLLGSAVAVAEQATSINYPICADRTKLLVGIAIVKSAMMGFIFMVMLLLILSEVFGLFSRAISFVSPTIMSALIGTIIVYTIVFAGLDEFITTVPGTPCAGFSDAIWTSGPPFFRLIGFLLSAIGLM